MARFSNSPPLARPGPGSIGTHPTPTLTHQGGSGWLPSDPHTALFNAAVSGFLADQFYETADQRIGRMADYVPHCDHEWLQKFIPWLRREAKMRSAAVMLAAEYGANNFPNRRQVVADTLQRPDEPGEIIGYWKTYHAHKLPSWLQRGINDALGRLYTERSAIKYDSRRSGWRFGDVITMTHPKPVSDHQSDLFKYLVYRRHDNDIEPPESLELIAEVRRAGKLTGDARRAMLASSEIPRGFTWEMVSGWAADGMDAAAWNATIPLMGAFALLRNLNNFDRKGISVAKREAVARKLTNPDDIREARLMPYNFLNAYKHLETDEWQKVLQIGCDHAIGNLPEIGGGTLIMVDCSLSMQSRVGGTHAKLHLSELAGFMAEVIGRRCERARIVTYSTEILGDMPPARHVSALKAGAEPRYKPQGMTNTWSCTAAAINRWHPDRVLIITDEQAHGGVIPDFDRRVVTWNLAGYQPHHLAHDARQHRLVSGVSDQALAMVPTALVLRDNSWPWDD